jgi:succinate--hydroxymethylglutarate CoA-transferase
VNLSARQLSEPGLLDDVSAALGARGTDPSTLVLEITESALMHDSDSLSTLNAIHDLGVALHVDDFGTGYSSLAYLKTLPVDVLKIDRAFVDGLGLGTDADDHAIVTAIIALARALSLGLVAEGVESAAQLEVLRELGCDRARVTCSRGRCRTASSSSGSDGTDDVGSRSRRRDRESAQLDGVMGNTPPLDGIRVLDFSRIIAGPLCTQQLADLGADVIKVEHPVTGDEMRARSPRGDRRGAAFLAFNRSKRSIAIDLSQARGQELARRLASGSDVVIENFRPGVMGRLGLGQAELRAADPALIFVSISAYGAAGSHSSRPGLDPVLQAESGMMALTGPIDGGPTRHPLSIIDTLTAAHATSAICAALLGRQRHGRGDFIDLCLLDTAIGALSNVGMQYLSDGTVPQRNGNRHVVGAPIDLFATATQPIYLAMATDRLFSDFCRVIGRSDLVENDRFATPAGRSRHRDALKVEIEAALTTRPADEWLAEMRHLPAGGVRTVDQALQAPEVLERDMVRHIPEGDHELALLGTPFKFADTDLAEFRPPPLLGEHTDDVLTTVLGMNPAEVEQLRRDGVVV